MSTKYDSVCCTCVSLHPKITRANKSKREKREFQLTYRNKTRVVNIKKEAKNSCFTALCAMSFSPLLIRTCAGYQVGEVIGSGTMAESVSFPAFLVPFFFVSICCLHSLFFHFQHFLFLSVSSACVQKGFDQLDPTRSSSCNQNC